ncbi:hypothetical protein HYFRA_00008413 [Hymenoscyphus fraxineus]|uniref:Uncharacterized protein n=1 Tax=Hymenoscyphus fraxineus TaxID=746836 RepID=A0A9N9KNG3_9HELO|nr:hypothetical protein HYFRA_00008413 [Hymenoscyphus fraxineus]
MVMRRKLELGTEEQMAKEHTDDSQTDDQRDDIQSHSERVALDELMLGVDDRGEVVTSYLFDFAFPELAIEQLDDSMLGVDDRREVLTSYLFSYNSRS